MGNIVHGAGLLNNVRYFPYHVQLGRYAAIDVTKVEEEQKEEHGGGNAVKWKVSYTIDGSTCELDFAINSGKDRKVKWIYFSLHDDTPEGYRPQLIHLSIRKAETTNLLKGGFMFYDLSCLQKHNTNTTTDHDVRGINIVRHTSVFVYGSGRRGGLVVREWKRKIGDEDPYMMTVAHYCAASSGYYFEPTRMDIGLSMIVKIHGSKDKGMDITVEGPSQDPAAALFCMFDEVKRSGTWNPTYSYPHCDKIPSQQRRGMSSWQSESEDSDSICIPPRRHHVPRPNGRSMELIDNKDINGTGNGNRIGRDQNIKFEIPIILWKKS